MPEDGGATPVTVVTGFLGSGKTSLLQRLLAAPELADTAVLVNEFGAVGLDHHLLRRVEGDMVLLQSGCLCCTIRGDLGGVIRDLHSRRERGEVRFRRVVIETTGLADPVPILATILAEPVIRHHFRLGNVITTVDAVNGAGHLDRQPESVKQAAVADRLLITKTDLAPATAIAALRRRLERLNPAAPLIESDPTRRVDANFLLALDVFDPDAKSETVRRWLAAELERSIGVSEHDHHDIDRHDARIHAFCLRVEQPLDWTGFALWLSMLLHRHGGDVLRVKGLLNVGADEPPLVVHGVQHLVHRPVHLDAWPDADRASRLVFIVRGLDRALIERSLAAFNRIANPTIAAAVS